MELGKAVFPRVSVPGAIPTVTIFVRHSAECPYEDDPAWKRCNCWKHLRWFSGGKQQFQATKSRTWVGAEKSRRELEAKLGAPTLAAQENEHKSVRDAIKDFITDKKGQGSVGDIAIGKYTRELEKFAIYCEHLGLHNIRQVNRTTLTNFRAEWNETYPSAITRQKVQGRLKEFFKFVYVSEYVERNPADALSKIKAHAIPTMPLEDEEYEHLLACIPEIFEDESKRNKVRMLIRCMRTSALAIHDAVCLERTRIKKSSGLWRIILRRQKSKVPVSVPIPDDLADELLTIANGNPKYIFWNTGNGKPKTVITDYQEAILKVFVKAGLANSDGSRMISHRLRDTAAKTWLENGASLDDVSKLLGHTSIKTTEKHYAQWVQSRQDRLDTAVTRTWTNNSKKKG